MPPVPDDLLRIVIDLIRDQSRVLSEIATGVAIGADRQAQILAMTTRMADTLTRLDSFLAAQSTANAQARADGDAAIRDERAALTRLYDLVAKGLKSSSVQRLLQLAAMAALYWFDRHGFTLPTGAPSP